MKVASASEGLSMNIYNFQMKDPDILIRGIEQIVYYSTRSGRTKGEIGAYADSYSANI